MKRTFFFLIFIFPGILSAQTLNQKAFDEKRNDEMLVGVCNREGFKMIRSNFDSIYQAEYSMYKPDQATLDQISKKLKKIRIKVVMGTWCGDSKDWVPRFYKVLDNVGFDEKKLTLVCVDHTLKTSFSGLEKMKIKRIPTFIIYKKKREIGRIVETPGDLIEKDLLKILQ
jgi:thiol-disulfide isomerase/thioredoxin